jgi:hypothetical protein
MLNGLHILLTYRCLNECDHCFLYCGPQVEGTFTLAGIRDAIDQAVEAGIEWFYLEGGEPFLHYPLMVEAARLARGRGLSVGIVTNGYWASTEEDASLWLRPLVELGIEDLAISEDTFHSDDPERSPARVAYCAAEGLGMPVGRICIEGPVVVQGPILDAAHRVAGRSAGEEDRIGGESAATGPAVEDDERHGAPVVGGGVSFRGRAVEKLLEGLPRRPFSCFVECTEEDLSNPGRVHLDPYGNVFVCQGLNIGNVRENRLRAIMEGYRPLEHPIVGPLLRGGPAELARVYGLPDGDAYVSGCHLCYLARRALIERFPAYLAPAQVYGLPS